MLIDYLPEFVREYEEIKRIMNTEQKEVDLLNSELNQIIENQFILFCDEFGISRFEKILDIIPDESDTLASRISRVYIRWNDDIPYTIHSLRRKLISLCGKNNFRLDINNYNLDLEVYLPLFGQVQELESMILRMIPCNLVVSSKNKIKCEVIGEQYLVTGSCICEVIELTDSSIECINLFGKCLTSLSTATIYETVISDSGGENVKILSNANCSSVSDICEVTLITDSINVSETINYYQNIASSGEVVEIISIN